MAANRIKEIDLDNMIARINRATGNPDKQTGSYIPGQYIRSSAYGGHKLERVCSTGGGVESITQGYVSKRELYDRLQSILTGIKIRSQS